MTASVRPDRRRRVGEFSVNTRFPAHRFAPLSRAIWCNPGLGDRREGWLPVQQKYNFTDLYNGLTGTVPYRPLAGAFEVAEACLKFATSETRARYPSFSSSAWREFATEKKLWKLVRRNSLTGLELDYSKNRRLDHRTWRCR